jgi:hypothetical protein
MQKRSSKSKDVNQLASVIVQVATNGQAPRTADGKNAFAVALGRRGGLKGGRARAASLTAERRSEIAASAAASRWSRKK